MKLIDPDGNSPISVAIKQFVKHGFKAGLKRQADTMLTRRFKKYMSDGQMKQFKEDLKEVLGTMDSEWWEIGIELIPGVGDMYGTGKFAKQAKEAYEKLQNLENKWTEKILKALPPKQREEFIEKLRKAGVRDARTDVDARNKVLNASEKHKGLDGHHGTSVSQDPSKAADPRNIEFKTRDDHFEAHDRNWQNRTNDNPDIYRN